MLILAGLGNPGPKYEHTRHNIGFMAVDAIARRWNFAPWRSKFQGQATEGTIGSERVLLLKPQTFMNESGRSVGEALKFYKLEPDALGRFDEAEQIYREAAQGVHAEDPALQLGRAKALIELGRHAEALDLLEAIDREGETTGPSILASARAYQGLQRPDDADRAYRTAMVKMVGLEPIARYAAFLRAVGRTGEAKEMVEEIDRRAAKTAGAFRKEAQAWQDLATRG